ncbi:hypothetical protein SEVIR_9G517051v4 [Setaria viridis]
MKYRPGWTANEIPSTPDPPGARHRARRGVALGIAGAREAAAPSPSVISAALGPSCAISRAHPLASLCSAAAADIFPRRRARGQRRPGRHRPAPSRAFSLPAALRLCRVEVFQCHGDSQRRGSAAWTWTRSLGGHQRCILTASVAPSAVVDGTFRLTMPLLLVSSNLQRRGCHSLLLSGIQSEMEGKDHKQHQKTIKL